ncbi:MAG: LacI family DNA-binding transcriptional regulator [bacterium]|nr:LacI family DNA-binding transcriptional regulator [bacterium]
MTIYDIAREAGVSASTVSRVINNKPGIRESTRKKVKKLLEQYDYTPDAAARSLVTQESRFIGILIEDIRVAHHTESAYVIEQEMTRRGFTCITFSTGSDPERKARYIEILEQRRVQGAILIGSMFGTPEVQQSIERHLSGIPVVLVNGGMELPNVYSVLSDEERGMEDCVTMLAGKGRRRLAYLMDVVTPSNLKKQRGFFTGLYRCGIPAGEDRVFTAPGSGTGPLDGIARGRQATRALLRAMPEADGILCATDLLAIGCLQELQDQGIPVPGRVAVAGVDNTLYGQLCTPALTTLDNRLADVSLAAARMLLDVLEQNPVNQTLMVPTRVIEREST